MFGESALYYNLYKQLPLPELVEKLNNRYRLDKTSDAYEQEIQKYKKSLDKNLTQTFEELKFLIDNAYKHRNKEEKKAIMNTTIRRALPKLVSNETLKKIFQEERECDNKGGDFNIINSALQNDALEKKIPKKTIELNQLKKKGRNKLNKETKIEISIPHHQEHYDYRHQDIDEDYQQEVYQGPINDEYNSDRGAKHPKMFFFTIKTAILTSLFIHEHIAAHQWDQ